MIPSKDSQKYHSNKTEFFHHDNSTINSDSDSLISYGKPDSHKSTIKEAPAIIAEKFSSDLKPCVLSKKKICAVKSEIYVNHKLNESRCSTKASVGNYGGGRGRGGRGGLGFGGLEGRKKGVWFVNLVGCLFCSRMSD